MAEGEWSGPLWGTTLIADLEALASELTLSKFDLLLVGDGSGTICKKSCGWACVAWTPPNNDVVFHNGATSCGTNNFAELFPYVQALWFFEQELRSKSITKRPRVEIISDSEVTVRCGNKIYARSANGCLWASIEYFERIFDIHWTHIYRNTNKFSKKCDWLAGGTRVALDKLRNNLFKES